MSSPGKARPYQGFHGKTLSPAISGLCHQGSLLAAVESHVIIITSPRHDTTRHRTTQYDLRLTLMLCLLSLTQPGSRVRASHAVGPAWHGTAILGTALERSI